MPSPYPWRRALLGVAAIAMAAFASAASAEPLTLAQALERAQSGSPAISAADANVRAAQGRAQQAGLRPNPEVSVEVENFTGSGPYSGFESVESTFALEQRLEFGGKRGARVNAAQAEVEAARLRVIVTRADVARDVRGAYAEALAAEDRAILAREAVERADDLARVVTTLVEVGREPPLRALRAQAAVDQARAKAQAADAEAAAARRSLATLIGLQDGDIQLVREDAEPAPAGPLDPTESVDVRLAEAETEAARASVKRERAGATPDVTFQAGVRRFEESGDQAVIIGFSAPIPIIDRNQGNVAAARADVEGAEARQRQALADSVRRGRDAEAALRAADARVAVLETRIVPQAQEALRLARLGYEAGKFPLLEVIDAQDALATAREDLIAARLDRARAIAALQRAAAR